MSGPARLVREESIRNNNVENLEEINLNALVNEVKAKGIGNRGSPTHSLTESVENLPVKRVWRTNPLFKRKTSKAKGGKRRQTRRSRRSQKK